MKVGAVDRIFSWSQWQLEKLGLRRAQRPDWSAVSRTASLPHSCRGRQRGQAHNHQLHQDHMKTHLQRAEGDRSTQPLVQSLFQFLLLVLMKGEGQWHWLSQAPYQQTAWELLLTAVMQTQSWPEHLLPSSHRPLPSWLRVVLTGVVLYCCVCCRPSWDH